MKSTLFMFILFFGSITFAETTRTSSTMPNENFVLPETTILNMAALYTELNTLESYSCLASDDVEAKCMYVSKVDELKCEFTIYVEILADRNEFTFDELSFSCK